MLDLLSVGAAAANSAGIAWAAYSNYREKKHADAGKAYLAVMLGMMLTLFLLAGFVGILKNGAFTPGGAGFSLSLNSNLCCSALFAILALLLAAWAFKSMAKSYVLEFSLFLLSTGYQVYLVATSSYPQEAGAVILAAYGLGMAAVLIGGRQFGQLLPSLGPNREGHNTTDLPSKGASMEGQTPASMAGSMIIYAVWNFLFVLLLGLL